MAKKRLFGLDPKKLDKILSIGTEVPGGSDIEDKKLPMKGEDTSAKRIDAPSPTASLDIFAEKPGSQIGRYKLLNILGEGGMGIVYLAEQKHPIRRQVALKVIKPGMDSAQVIGRFEAERQALALLDHPNVAHVFDAGTTKFGRPYFIMEYVKGIPITEHCDRQKLTIEERLKLFVKVCEAIQHAHQKGIIHRDIKPSNIQVCIQGEQFVPKVIDFGVAKALAQPLTERTLVTEQGQMLGTPEYISPEQAEMTNQDIDTRSDIYSLGVLLYELLTGTLPFESKTLRKGSLEQMRQVIRETEPKTPSTRLSSLDADASSKLAKCCQSDTETLRRKLRGDLDWITLKAMDKDRMRRYQTAHTLAEDIERHLNDEPVLAGPPGTLYRIQKLIRRHKALATGLTAVLLVLLAGIAGILIFAVKADRQARIAEAVTDFLDEDLLGAVALQQAMSEDVTVRSILDAAGVRLEGRFADQPLVEAAVRHSLGKTYIELGRHRDAEYHLKQAYDLRRRQLGGNDLRTLDSMSQLGRLYMLHGPTKEAQPLLAQALEYRRRVQGSEHVETLLNGVWLGRVYADLAVYDKAEQLLTTAFESCNRLFGKHNLITLEAMNGLAFLHIVRGQRVDDAKPLVFEGWEIARELLGEGHRLTLDFMSHVSWFEARAGQFETAVRHAHTFLETSERVLGREHRQTISARGGLGQIYIMQHKYELAEPLLVESVQLGRKILGRGNTEILFFTALLGDIHAQQGEYQQAESLYIEVLTDGRRVLPVSNVILRVTAFRLISLYAMWERADKLNGWCLQELERLAEVDDHNHSATLNILNSWAWRQATYPSEAILKSTEAVKNAEKACKLSGWKNAAFIDTLAAAYAERGDFEAAIREQNKAIELVTRGSEVPAAGQGLRYNLRLFELGRVIRESALDSHARAMIRMEKYDAAEQSLTELLKSVRKHLGEAHPETRGCILTFIELYEAWNKPEKAKEWRTKLSKTEAKIE